MSIEAVKTYTRSSRSGHVLVLPQPISIERTERTERVGRVLDKVSIWFEAKFNNGLRSQCYMNSLAWNIGHLSFIVLNRDRLHRVTLRIKHSARCDET